MFVWRKKIIILTAVLITVGNFVFTHSEARAVSTTYPKVVNYYLNLSLTEVDARKLADWDVVILDMEIQAKNKDLLKKMRAWNPNIILLVYITPQEIRQDALSAGNAMRRDLAQGISDSWYLKNSQGKKLSWWQGTYLLNVGNDQFDKYLAGFVYNKLLATGLWDGVFYDNAWDNITYFAGQDVDMDNNGVKDSDADVKWLKGMKTVYTETRNLVGDKYLLVGNSDSSQYTSELNGMMLENFSNQKWNEWMAKYDYNAEKRRPPQMNMINANTGNTNKQNYQQMRFGLTSALLEDGYYSYDYGDQNHGQTWWYDEYNVGLGEAMGDAKSKQNYNTYQPDVWERDFQNGLSIVNSTNQTKTVELGGDYEKIHGTQDKKVNDGSIVSKVNVAASDGLVLLKTFSTLDDVLYANGDFLRFFKPDGSRSRNGFFVFEPGRAGGVQIEHIDLTGDGRKDTLVVYQDRLEAWRNDGQVLIKKYPYGASYKGELRVAVGDLNSDGAIDIIVAPSPNYPAPIKVYSRDGIETRADWYPFGKDYLGGYNLAVGHFGDSAKNNLVIGTGLGSVPIAHIFDYNYKLLRAWWPFDVKFRGGVSVATGDLDGNGIDEVIAGPGKGMAPVIRVFDSFGKKLYPEFTAYTSLAKPGIKVLTADVDFDGKDEIVGESEGL